ncbi:MAG: hypothetical protein HW387_1348 [Parachlamydiales bacterium]|nr:hypothetical protein [Parachlamydiales bacterium]
MNFTREPIIETVITPREGCKLVVRSSKGINQEDYFVDAVEVVSFGHCIFFRSQERPKSFFVPVSDYEILELKETRMVLKNVSSERSIKIGGGRENPVRSQPREPVEEVQRSESEPEASTAPMMQDRDKKQRDRRRSRRRRGGPMDVRQDTPPSEAEPISTPTTEGVEKSAVEPAPAHSFISKLFPPPPTLIKETLSRYKTTEEGTYLAPSFPDDLEPPVSEPKPKQDNETKTED